MVTKTQSPRDIGIDLLKSFAVFGVIIIHMCSTGYSYPVTSFNWISTALWGSLTRGSVPIFLMCSGALLLNPDKKISLKRLYLKNISRIIIAMLVWSMAYKVYHLIVSDAFGTLSMIQAFKEVILFKQEFHMYYIHIMIIVYMFLPLARIFIKNASRQDLIYALAIWFILGIVYPTVRFYWPFNLLSGIPVQWLINMTYASIGYGILGYYLSKYPLSLKWNCVLFGFGFFYVFGLTSYVSAKNGILCERFFEGMSVGVALLAVGLFGLCYNMKDKLSRNTAAICTKLSNGSFCIYLVHVFIMYLFAHFGIDVCDFSCLISVPVLSALNLLISYAIYLMLSKIPIVNRWLI